MSDRTTSRNTPPIRIGGKTYSRLEDMPPEMRQKFEQMVKQMRDSGMLEDKNRDGIPDRFETSLRIAGWFGKLTGNPQLKERLQQQMKAFGASAATTTSTTRAASPRASSAAARTPPSPAEPARVRTTSTSARAAATARNASREPHQSAVQRDDRNLHEGTGLGEFLRKLVIVSAVVISGYVLIRFLGGG